MDDIQLLEAIERYLAGDMSTQEMAQFESIRKKTPEIDQMVVEHEMFLLQIDQFAKRKNFAQLSKQTFDRLNAAGEWDIVDENTTKGKVIVLWNKYEKSNCYCRISWRFYCIVYFFHDHVLLS
jgi:hypothetical protein